MSEKLRTVIASSFTLIPESTSPSAYNDSFLSKHSQSATHAQSVLCVRNILSPETIAQNKKELVATIDLEQVALEEARQGLNVLRMWGEDQHEEGSPIEDYKRKAKDRWPQATVFEQELPWDRLRIAVSDGVLL